MPVPGAVQSDGERIALTLNNLGVLHSDQNRMEEARKAYEEALAICRKLAASNPDTYLPDLAMTLNNIGILHSSQNRTEEAWKAYQEALAIYRRHLAPGGIIAFHISNQHVDLEGPIAALAASAGLQARHVHSLADESRGEFNATWILVTDNGDFFQQPELGSHAYYPDMKPGIRVWTDDYSALLPVLRW